MTTQRNNKIFFALLVMLALFGLGAYSGNRFEGMISDGSAVGTTRPVIISGVDSDGNVQHLKVGTDGSIHFAAMQASIDSISAILRPDSSGGLLLYRNIDTNATGAIVKNTIGQVYGWYMFNNASSVRYVKLYNVATAPTVGTTTPVLTIPLPPGGGANVEYTNGIAFSNGIGIGATTGVADNNTTAPSANEVVVNLFYR